MPSVLKRKRGSIDITDSLKRSKSVQDMPTAPLPDFSKAGWDAAFGALGNPDGLAVVGVNGNVDTYEKYNESSDAIDFEELQSLGKLKKKNKSVTRPQENSTTEVQPTHTADWKVSQPIGGRMIDLDPVFAEDEKFLIVAQQKSLKVFSTSDSLLSRSIDFEFSQRSADARIVSYVLSSTDPNLIWVACSDSIVYRVNWTTGESIFWVTEDATGIISMTVASIESAGRRRDVVYTTGLRAEGDWHITAHVFTLPGDPVTTDAKVIYTSPQEIQYLKAVPDGSIIVAASGSRILLGNLRSSDFSNVNDLKYPFRFFESTEFISTLDIRVSDAPIISQRKSSKGEKARTVDIVVGDVKGAIWVHHDLLANLMKPEIARTSLLPRKLHWHRKAVRSVKWSLDGNYIISGGSETVMVLWQLDTGKQQYLPHMSATIQNIVVSPFGTSYAIRLGDNSTMVLSTADLKPTAHISGIQAQVMSFRVSPDERVTRIEEERHQKPLMERTPALINPANPSHLLLAVGDSQEVNPKSALLRSVPYLQTFDIAASHTLSRQALTRTNVTNKLIAPNAHRISEARVVHMKISYDGKWLATVDEWVPPRRDVMFLGHEGMSLKDEQRKRREVYLKFWKWNDSSKNWDLVSRIDAPHRLAPEDYGAGKVLDLVADRNSLAFSTLGEDGAVCVWRPRVRRRDGVIVRGKGDEPLKSWECEQLISTGKPALRDEISDIAETQHEHGCLAFSEDGSIIAAALSGKEDGVIYLIDSFNGSITSMRPNLYRGDALTMAFISQYLVIVSDDLLVYDLVLDEPKYEITLNRARGLMSLEQRSEMIHLAVDLNSQSFAVAVPTQSSVENWLDDGLKVSPGPIAKSHTEIAVFSPQHASPLLTQSLSSFATALVPAVGAPGYVVLDAAAEVTTLAPKTSQALASMARPLADLNLDKEDDAQPSGILTNLIENPEDDIDDEEPAEDVEMAEVDEDDGPPVVSQQQLARVFDIGPAFTLPPIEEMFYQVADLFSSKPLMQSA